MFLSSVKAQISSFSFIGTSGRMSNVLSILLSFNNTTFILSFELKDCQDLSEDPNNIFLRTLISVSFTQLGLNFRQEGQNCFALHMGLLEYPKFSVLLYLTFLTSFISFLQGRQGKTRTKTRGRREKALSGYDEGKGKGRPRIPKEIRF